MKRIEKKITIHNKDGTRVRKSVYGYSYAEIERKIAKLNSENCPAFDDLIAEWQDEHFKTIEPYTQTCYTAPCKDVVAHFGKTPINEITANDIFLFVNLMAKQGFARQTVKLRLSVMRQAFDYAILKGYIDSNPTAPVKIPKTVRAGKKIDAPSLDDLERVKNSVDDPFGLFAYLLLYTGLRRSELLALCYEDAQGDFINVNKVCIFINNKPYIRPYTKTQAGMRQVPILNPIKPYLSGRGLIFNKDGEPLSKSQVDKMYRAYQSRTGVKATPHQLRHAFATICYDAGVDSKQAQYILGHSKESVTRDIYTTIRQQKIDDATQKLNNLLS